MPRETDFVVLLLPNTSRPEFTIPLIEETYEAEI